MKKFRDDCGLENANKESTCDGVTRLLCCGCLKYKFNIGDKVRVKKYPSRGVIVDVSPWGLLGVRTDIRNEEKSWFCPPDIEKEEKE